MYCPNCGTVAKPKKVTKGSFLIEVFLWLLFIIPGVIYSLWRLTTKAEVCPKCGAPNMIPSPVQMQTSASCASNLRDSQVRVTEAVQCSQFRPRRHANPKLVVDRQKCHCVPSEMIRDCRMAVGVLRPDPNDVDIAVTGRLFSALNKSIWTSTFPNLPAANRRAMRRSS